MEAPNLCPQPSNCLIHCFSDAARFDVNRTLCPILFDSGIPYLVVPRNGGTTMISLFRFIANFLAMEQAKHERITGRVVTEAVIDLPRSYNNEGHRHILRSAAAFIGVRIREFLDRPTFAAFGYAPFHHNVRKVLVFDFGGVVLCSSLLEIQHSDRNITVLASETSYGCPLLNFFREDLGVQIQEHGSEFRSLYAQCEQVKNVLCSGQPYGVVDVRLLPRRQGVQIPPPPVSLEFLTHLNLHWIRTNIYLCLLQVGEISFDVVDEVILLGVSVGIPIVRRTLESLFPGKRLRNEFEPETFVRGRAQLLATWCYNNPMVVAADDIDRVWPEC